MTTEEPADQGQASEVSAPTLSTTSGEGLLTIGAGLALGVYVIFELIAGEYYQPWLVLTPAALILILPRVGRAATEQIAPMAVILKALGYVIAVTGLFDALNAIRFDGLNEGMEILGGLIAYAGYVLAFLGARSIKT